MTKTDQAIHTSPDDLEKIASVPGNYIKRVFKPDPTCSWRNLKITNEGVYSITPSRVARWMAKDIFEAYKIAYCHEPKYIVDSTANVGGNTLAFSRVYENVMAVEIKPRTCQILRDNISVFGYKNIQVINADFCNILNVDLLSKVDIIFVDPPWYINGIKNEEMALSATKLNAPGLADIVLKIRYIAERLVQKNILCVFKVPWGYSNKVRENRRFRYTKIDLLYFYC